MPVGNTIIAKGEHNVYDEGIVVNAAIKPGKLIKLDTTTDSDIDRPKVRLFPTANETGMVSFAIEDGLVGKEIADDYLVGHPCRYVSPRPGDEAFIFVASGSNVALGDRMTFGASGNLIPFVNGTSRQVVCEMREGSGGALVADTRLKVRFV